MVHSRCRASGFVHGCLQRLVVLVGCAAVVKACDSLVEIWEAMHAAATSSPGVLRPLMDVPLQI